MVVPKTEVVITVGGALCARCEVLPGEYILGRGAGCDVTVDAERVAGQHARLIVNYSEWLIEDLGSAEGTRVNGERVTEPRRIFSGQRIEVGAATVELHRVHGRTQAGDSLPPDLAAVRALLPETLVHGQRYEIGNVVAQGGMGAILAARDGPIARSVAMKIMLQSRSADDAVRFVQEAQITGQLEHPNIVPVHELSVDEHGQPFYTMKMVRGVTLKKVLEQCDTDLRSVNPDQRSGPHSLPALLTAFQKVCDAVAFAHSRGVLHRDLKPENLMLGEYGEVLVMDWGLAKAMEKHQTPKHEPRAGARRSDDTRRTQRHLRARCDPVFDPHPAPARRRR